MSEDTQGMSAPAGGHDPHRDAERAAQVEGGAEEAQNAPEPEKTAETTETTTTAPNDAQAQASDVGEGSREMTPEEKAEFDSMVDYTITEETLEQFNAARAEGMEPFKVGDAVKLAKDHPLVTGATA